MDLKPINVPAGCEDDVKHVMAQYTEGGESALKQLASMITVMKREYSKVRLIYKLTAFNLSNRLHPILNYYFYSKLKLI